MTENESPIAIDYYTDALCVWAYFGQIKVDELKREFGARIELHYKFIPLFGCCETRIGEGWEEGGYEGYSRHVLELATNFPHVEIHPRIWLDARPASSLPVHLVLKAVQLLERRDELPTGEHGEKTLFETLVWNLRLGFFPKELTLHGMTLPLEYRFEPGHRADGVTLVVPAAVIRQISPGRLDWLVPGMLEEKLVALIRSLPKSLRKQFVPAPDYARQALARLTPGDTPLVQALGRVLLDLTGVQVPEDAWDLDALPDYLKMRVRVVDGAGKILGAGRDLLALQQRHGDVAAAEPAGSGAHPLAREGITRWDFGELPEQVETQAQGMGSPAGPRWWTRATAWPSRCSVPGPKPASGTAPGCGAWFCWHCPPKYANCAGGCNNPLPP